MDSESSGRRAPRLIVPYQRFAIRTAVGILALLFLAQAVTALRITAQLRASGTYVACAVGVLVGLLLVQVVLCRAAFTTGARRGWRLALLGHAGLTFPPFLAFGEAWLVMPGFLAGWCLLLMPPVWHWVWYGTVLVAQAVFADALRLAPGRVIGTVVGTACIGLMTYGVVRLAALVRDVPQVEVSRERERFERDLHDLIGQRLVVIALKSELANRLIGTDRDGACEQLSAVIDVVRQTQSDVHAVAQGRPINSLDAELASARSVLESAGTACQFEVSCGELPDQLRDVLGATVRESVTNVLRHSAAKTCRIGVSERAGQIELVATNDGVPDDRKASPASGMGLRNLRERARAVGGEFTAGMAGPGRFRLVVRLPRDPAR